MCVLVGKMLVFRAIDSSHEFALLCLSRVISFTHAAVIFVVQLLERQ